MTTVANQPVGPDSISGKIGAVKSGKNTGLRAGYLGTAAAPNTVPTVTAGASGSALGFKQALPMESAGTLTKIEKPFKGK